MSPAQSRSGGDLFIVHNTDDDWKVHRYLHDWCEIARAFDIATGYFEIGPLLSLDGQRQKLDQSRIRMGDEVSKRTKRALQEDLANIAYGKPVRTRSERARAFETREGAFLERYRDEAREVILASLDKYRVGGVEQLADPHVFRLSPFREMGRVPGVIRRFGGAEGLQVTLEEVQRRLYAA